MFQRKVIPYVVFIIFCGGFLQMSYQQNFVGITTKQDLTFCMQNHTMSNTLQTFWHDANSDCELEPRQLLAMYTKLKEELTIKSGIDDDDQCSILLSHHMRKKLLTILANQLEEAFITKSINNNRELQQLVTDVHLIDKRLSLAIWERVINEIYIFVDSREIIEQLMQWKWEDIEALALQLFLNKYQMQIYHSENLLSLVSYYLARLLNSKTLQTTTYNRLKPLYNRLPEGLRSLYESNKKHQIGLLNYAHWEYLYAPRDNGPDSERRTPLTWSQDKNSTDSDGHLVIDLNSKGLIAFGSRFGASTKFLYADSEQRAAYFWIGHGLKPSRWWHVISPHELFSQGIHQYLLFQNNDTKELLCATTEYDENRRYVTLLDVRDNMQNPACQWLVKVFT